MANPTIIRLQDGNVMPQLGLGVWKASNEEVIAAIHKALASAEGNDTIKVSQRTIAHKNS